ncbi:MAG TPA: phage tail tape measure protein [Phycisphaerae bacterium]|nr:phage tail tape measure protein [Phycisphaerae bacterium]
MSNPQGIRAGKAFVELFADDSKLVRALKRAEAKLRAFGDRLQTLGRKLLALGTVAAAPLGLATKIFAGFEDQMLTVRGVTGATEKQFKDLTDQAKLLGRTTSFTAKQVAEGMTSLGRAGFSPDEIQAAIPAVLNLARATGTELGEAADYAANAVRAFGLKAGDTVMVADVLTATANGSAQTLTDLAEAMSYVAPVAADAGETIQSTSQALGVLANMGIKGSMAGTTLRQIMLRLADPAVRDKLGELGVAATDAKGNLRPLGTVLSEVGKAMAKMPNAERLTLARDLFDQRAVSGALKLGGSPEQMQQLADAISKAGGAAERTAKMMDSGLGGAFRMMMSAAEGVAIAVGEAMASMISGWMGKVQRTAEMIAEWVGQNKQLVTTVALVVVGVLGAGAAFTVLGVSLKGLAAAVGVVAKAFVLLGGVIKIAVALLTALLSPIGLVIAAVGALGVYLLSVTGAGGKALAWLGERFDQLKQDALAAWQGIGDALAAGDISLAAKILWLTLKMEWQKGVNALTGYWVAFKRKFTDILDSFVYGGQVIWTDFVYGLQSLWARLVGGLRTIWAKFTAWHARTVESTANWMAKRWMEAQALFDDSIDVKFVTQHIDQQSTQRMEAIDHQERSDIAAAQSKRDQALQEAQAARQNRLAEIGRADAENERQRADEYARQLAGSEAELAKARKEWRDALDEARHKREVKESTAPAGPGSPQALMDQLRNAAEGVGQQLAQAKVGVGGTFNVSALLGLQAGNVEDRIAKASEQTAENTKRLLEEAQRGNLVFG